MPPARRSNRKRKAGDISDASESESVTSSTSALSASAPAASKSKKLTKQEKAELRERARLAVMKPSSKPTTPSKTTTATTTAKRGRASSQPTPPKKSTSSPKKAAASIPPTIEEKEKEDEDEEEAEQMQTKRRRLNPRRTSPAARRFKAAVTAVRLANSATSKRKASSSSSADISTSTSTTSTPSRTTRTKKEDKKAVMKRVKEWAEKEKQKTSGKAQESKETTEKTRTPTRAAKTTKVKERAAEIDEAVQVANRLQDPEIPGPSVPLSSKTRPTIPPATTTPFPTPVQVAGPASPQPSPLSPSVPLTTQTHFPQPRNDDDNNKKNNNNIPGPPSDTKRSRRSPRRQTFPARMVNFETTMTTNPKPSHNDDSVLPTPTTMNVVSSRPSVNQASRQPMQQLPTSSRDNDESVLPTPTSMNVRPSLNEASRQTKQQLPSPKSSSVTHKIPESPLPLQQQIHELVIANTKAEEPRPLQQQIHELVIANTKADQENLPLPFTQSPGENNDENESESDYGHEDEEDDQDEENDNENYDEIDNRYKNQYQYQTETAARGGGWSKYVVALCLLGSLIAMGIAFSNEEMTVTVLNDTLLYFLGNKATAEKLSGTPCFLDDEAPYGNIAAVPAACTNASSVVPCPEHGLCEHGLLVGCDSTHYEVSAFNDTCVHSFAFNETKQSLKQILENWTVAHMCGSKECPEVSHEEQGMPRFHLKDLFRQLEMESSDLVYFQDDSSVVIVLDGESDEFVSLKADHVLKFPFLCWLTRSLIWIVGLIGAYLYVAGEILFRQLFHVGQAYPLASLLGVLIILSFRWIQAQKAFRKQLVLDVAQVRGLALEKLQQDVGGDSHEHEEHAVLHIRDAIAWEMYPMQRSKRDYIVKKVWPKVVSDIKQDNRIRKRNRIIQGKPRDHWQWVAKVSSTSSPRSG